jgi:Ca2+-binding EF-hand superfamily protein
MMMGGSMGGFDPSAMLARFDRNGNKMLDPDETQGPAGFFLQRMAQSNPKIDLSKPIPLETIAGEFERMRQERMGGSSFGGGSPWGGAPITEQEQSGPQPLVPTFGVPVAPGSVRTFGSAGTTEPAVAVTERDLREAEDRMGRYDRNNDGFLSPDEMSGGRWSDDPMQYDRNADGKLSKEELAVRYAKRRIAEEQQQQQGSTDQNGGGDSRFGGRSSMMFMGGGMGGGGMIPPVGEGGGDRGGERGGEGEKGSEQKERPKSLRQMSTREKTDKESGKPDWFTRDDKDTDGQISMAEFATNWDEGTVTDFAKFDLNTDGFITTIEVRKAIANGATRSGGSSRSSSSMASSSRRDSRGSADTAAPTPSASSETKTEPAASTASPTSGEPTADKPATPAPAPATSADDPKFKKMLEWATKQIGKYDKNGDGALTPNEYSEMPVPPKNEWDYDGDGRITAEEYAKARSS